MNRRLGCEEKNGRRHWEEDESDLCCPIRRAFFIRSNFKCREGVRLSVNQSVLRALLEIPLDKSAGRCVLDQATVRGRQVVAESGVCSSAIAVPVKKDAAAIAARKHLQIVLDQLNPAGGSMDPGDGSGRHAKRKGKKAADHQSD